MVGTFARVSIGKDFTFLVNLFNFIMHVIQTIAGLGENAGGPSRTVTALAGHLSTIVGTVSLLTISRPGEGRICPSCGNVSLKVVEEQSGISRYWQSSARKELAALLRGDSRAIVHDHGVWLPFNHAVAAVCKRRAGAVRLVSPRGMLEPWALGFGSLKKRLALLAYQSADLKSASGFHATSNGEAENIRRLGFDQPIAVIPNAVNAPSALPIKSLARGQTKQALFLSRIHPKKGLFDLINAWNLVRPANWRLSIVGGSEAGHREELEQLICSLGLEECIRVASQVSEEDKWSVYAESDLFILPSYSENFGVVIAEAMLMGLPVITTKGTPWSVIDEAGCGWYIDTGVVALKAALEEAFRAPIDQLEAMGARGKQVVTDRFDWSRIAQQMAEFYSWMIQGGTRPQCVYRD